MPAETLITVRVTPRASRTAVTAVGPEGVRISVSAPPVDGAANLAVCRVLADALGVPRGAVEVKTGDHGRSKVVRVSGLEAGEAQRRLEAACTKR